MVTSETTRPTDALVELATALGGANVEHGADYIVFDLEDAVVNANVKDGAARIRIRVYLGYAEPSVVESWVARQPQPISGCLQVVNHRDGAVEPRLLFERPVTGTEWSSDPLADDIRASLDAWSNDETVNYTSCRGGAFQVRDDPRDLSPSNAWLLLGDQASYPGRDELAVLRDEGNVGIFDLQWTAAKQTLLGDLALIYFMAPDKAACFITRAASNAFFARDIEVNADRDVADEQRWAYFTPPIEIEPIPFKTLQAAAGGHLILKGRSGKFLRPETVAALLPIRAKNSEDQAELERVMSVPVGLADLPPPEDIDIESWKQIAAGALGLEAQVCRYVVEPLLEHVLHGTTLKPKSEYRVPGGSIDYVIRNGTAPTTAIEVKLATVEPPSGDWSESKDFRQLRPYMDELGVPGVLIDAHRVLLVDHGADHPYRDIARRTASSNDVDAIRRHLVRL